MNQRIRSDRERSRIVLLAHEPVRETFSADEKRDLAIFLSRERRRLELEPVLAAIEVAIDAIGWHRARPIVEAVTGCPRPTRRGRWWRGLGKRKGSRLLYELERIPAQTRLPIVDHHTKGALR